MGILLLCYCSLLCTCPRGNWLPFYLGKNTTELAEGERRLVILEDGLMTCEVRERKFTSGNQSITLAIVAYRTGTGKVVLVASSAQRRLAMDFVTTTDKMGELWRKDCQALIKLAFWLEFSRSSGAESKQTHDHFFRLFQDLPVTMVTAFQGYQE